MSISSNPMHFLWTEKYRPSTLSEVVIPQEFKDALMRYVKDGKCPSFIFYSPEPGTGKTTTAEALVNDLGSTKLFINASTENSIDTIRNLVAQFATTASLLSDSPIKVVILDEADRLSPAAQDGLKGLIEEVAHLCSFILTCNNKAKLIDPLRSRCTEIDFIYTEEQQLELSTNMLKRMMEICKLEGVEFDPKALAQITKRCIPDNRKLLQTVQKYKDQYGKIDSGILAVSQAQDVGTLVAALKGQAFKSTLQWALDNADSIGDDFYRYIYNALKDAVSDQTHAQLILTLNDYQRHHNTVPDRFLHLSAMCSQIMIESQFK